MEPLGAAPRVELGDPLSARTLGALSLTGALLGLLAAILPPGLAALGVMALVALVPGALLTAVLPPLPRALAVVAIPAVGVSLVSLLVSAQLAAAVSLPQATRWLLVAVGLVGGGLLLRRGARDHGAVESPGGRERPASTGLALVGPALAAVGVVFALSAIPTVRASEYSSFGLGAQVPLLVVAVALCLLGVLLAVRSRGWWSAWAALTLLVIARRGHTLLGTDEPLYQWTYRHLGVMDWFAHSGTLARDVDVYSNWPGALATASWLTQVSDLSRFDLAQSYILGHHLVLVVLVYALARAAGLSPWASLVAATLVEVADWVGQDYVAPQSFAMLLAIVVLAALLVSRDERYRAGSLWVAGIAFTAIVWAHQLTPVWLLLVLFALVVLRVVRPVWAVLPFLAVQAVMVAINLGPLLAHSTGISLDVLANTAGNITSPVSPGQALTSRVVTLLALALWGSAALLAGHRLLTQRAGLVAPILAFSPLVLLMTGYGGEAIYRVYLYSLPGVGLILAPPVTALLLAGWGRFVAAGTATMALCLAALQGSLGGWYAGLFPREDVELAMRLERAAGEDGLIATPIVGFPREVTWHYVAQARRDALGETVWSLQNELVTPEGISATPVDRLTRQTQQQMSEAPVYVVLSGPMQVYARQYGALPPGGLQQLGELLRDRGWTAVVDGATTVFTNPAGAQAFEQTRQAPAHAGR